MTSLLTNTAAMNALATLRQINKDLADTESKISSGLEVDSGEDNASFYQISSTLSADSAVNEAIYDGLNVTKTSLQTAEDGAKAIQESAKEFLTKTNFTAGAGTSAEEVQNDLLNQVKLMETYLASATNNGDDLIGAASYGTVTVTQTEGGDGTITYAATNGDATVGVARNVTAGISRAGGEYNNITVAVGTYDLASEVAELKAIATDFAANAEGDNSEAYLASINKQVEAIYSNITSITTQLGQSKGTIESQQEFLTKQIDTLDSSVGAMVDADLEEESARLSALQTQQQLATQALSIANESTSSVMTLFQ